MHVLYTYPLYRVKVDISSWNTLFRDGDMKYITSLNACDLY